MKQKLLLLLGLLLWSFNMNVVLADDQPNVTVIEDLDKYEGTDPFVYNQADGKVYVLNNVGSYERYGVYERVSTLKVAGGGDTEIEYIETTTDMSIIPYINTGYVHKANTRIVAEVNITDNSVRNYEAIFGSRAGYGNQMYVFFWRFNQDNAGCFARNAEVRGSQLIPTGEKIIIDASGVELNAYYLDDEEPAATITGEGDPAGGSTPMYIFDLCHGDHIDNSQAYFKLYSFKIYEGDELVMDLKPFVSSTGNAGLIDKIGGKKFFSGNAGKFVVSPDGQAAVDAAGVTVYEGKMVFNTTDSKLYKYTGGQFKAIGERTTKPIEFTDYKNMNNWQTNDGHKSVFWPGEGLSIIEYDESEDANYIDNYSGIGGYEPLMVQIPVEEGEDYNFMFDYVGCAYNSWHGVPMHVFVTNRYDLGTTEAGLAPGGDVLATFECPFDGTDFESVHVSLDFTAQQDNQTIVAQFGDCDDGANFWFEFHQLTVSKYVYPESYRALNPFGPQIELLIPEIEAYAGNTLPALKTALDEAVAEAKASLRSEDLGVQKAALDKLKSAYQAVKDNDISLLKAIIAIAKSEGVDVTEYEAFCEEGVAGTADQVDRLRVERKVAHLEKDRKSDWAGHTPAAGDFYLYNVGTGAYLTSGSDWGTHAAVGYPGLVATLIEAEGGYNIQFNELIQGDARDKFFGGSPYVDCFDNGKDVFSFEPVDGKPGVYNIHGVRGYLAFDPTGNTDTGRKYFNTVTGEWATPDNEMAEWILVTKDDRLAGIDQASEQNPFDVTVLIRDASFNKFAALDEPWLGINQGWGWGDAWFGDKNTETWNTEDYELAQTVKFPRRGIYEISVQAYYRDGNFEDHVKSVKNGEPLVKAPVLFANGNEQSLVYIHTAADKAPGEGDNSDIGNMPNSMYQASLFFENGLYWNRVQVVVPEDNSEVTIGIRKKAGNRGGNWIVADNFRAVYLGENPAKEEYINALAAIKDGGRYRVFTEVDGQKYYLTNEGSLSADADAAPTFTFTKVKGEEYEYGFKLMDVCFTNPDLVNNEAALNSGRIRTNTQAVPRDTWEAQAFLLGENGKFAVRATNAAGGDSGWALVAKAFWTVNAGPVAEYSFDKNYIWQIEENDNFRDIKLNLVFGDKTIASEVSAQEAGKEPVAPATFVDRLHGLYKLVPDVQVIDEETEEVNFVAEWAGPFDFSENFDGAKWYNMTIRGSYYVAVDETEPYYPKADKALNHATSQWAFKAVEGEPFQMIIWNRAFSAGSTLSVDGENVVMREGEAKWEIFANNDGFVMRPVGGGENDWVNQNGGSSGPLQFWHSTNGRTDNGSTFRVSEAPEIDPDAIADVKAADGNYTIYDIAGRRVAQPTKGVFIINRKKVAVK